MRRVASPGLLHESSLMVSNLLCLSNENPSPLYIAWFTVHVRPLNGWSVSRSRRQDIYCMDVGCAEWNKRWQPECVFKRAVECAIGRRLVMLALWTLWIAKPLSGFIFRSLRFLAADQNRYPVLSSLLIRFSGFPIVWRITIWCCLFPSMNFEGLNAQGIVWWWERNCSFLIVSIMLCYIESPAVKISLFLNMWLIHWHFRFLINIWLPPMT